MIHGTINIKLTAYSCICWLFIEYIMMHGTINIKLTAYSCICWLFIEYIMMHGTINIKKKVPIPLYASYFTSTKNFWNIPD